MATQKCGGCRHGAALVGDLRRCSRCLAVAYCSRRCQKSDWKATHKSACRPLAAAAAETTKTPAAATPDVLVSRSSRRNNRHGTEIADAQSRVRHPTVGQALAAELEAYRVVGADPADCPNRATAVDPSWWGPVGWATFGANSRSLRNRRESRAAQLFEGCRKTTTLSETLAPETRPVPSAYTTAAEPRSMTAAIDPGSVVADVDGDFTANARDGGGGSGGHGKSPIEIENSSVVIEKSLDEGPAKRRRPPPAVRRLGARR